MTNEFKYLMLLLGAASGGFAVQPPKEPVDWERIANLAREQQIEPLLACALKQAPELDCPSELREMLTAKMLRAAMYDFQRQHQVMRLLSEMEEEGVHTVLLKGYAVARYYASPECRVSSDVDLFIDPRDEEHACEFLKKQEFTVEPRWKNGHHAVCHHQRLGCVELHVLLYDEIVEEIWFGKMDGQEFVQEEHRRMDSIHGPYHTLGDTDNLIFLALHMIKHFIMSGMSLRMMMDVSLFFSRNKKSIDSDRFWYTLRELKYDQLMACVLGAAVKYCGFDAIDFPGLPAVDTAHMDLVLNDLEAGGWLGFNDKRAREDAWYEYNRQKMLKDKSPMQYKFYMLRWRTGGAWRKLFPSIDVLALRYPCVRKNSLCVPFAWFHWLFAKQLVRVLRGAATQQIVSDREILSESGRERLRIFRELNMM